MANTLFIGKVYHRFGELPSTNDTAAAFLGPTPGQQGTAKSRPPEGTVVRADSQSAGRGQFGSRWESAAGQNLTLSIILYPNWLEIKAQFYLSMAIALGLVDTTKHYLGTTSGEPITTKWPNDLYISNRKASGILIQNTLSGNKWSAAIIGIGLNVNQLEFPQNLGQATSLASAAGQSFELDAVAETLFECVERRYLQLKSGKKAEIHEEYERHLYRQGLPTLFRRPNEETFSGIIQGVQPDGRLIMETDQGLENFDLKSLAMVI